ncbi:eukaryotic translation initiation factor 4e-2-like protein, partial [Trifolium pratense]
SLHDQIFKPSKLPGNADFHLFKDGIEPKWEDPECANGGKWTLTSKGKGNLDTTWLETLMALIGEQFGDSEDICGVVVSVRQWQDKLSLWTKTAANESVQSMEPFRYAKLHCIVVLSGGRGATNCSCYSETLFHPYICALLSCHFIYFEWNSSPLLTLWASEGSGRKSLMLATS